MQHRLTKRDILDYAMRAIMRDIDALNNLPSNDGAYSLGMLQDFLADVTSRISQMDGRSAGATATVIYTCRGCVGCADYLECTSSYRKD